MDPVTLAVPDDRLPTIVEEMGEAIPFPVRAVLEQRPAPRDRGILLRHDARNGTTLAGPAIVQLLPSDAARMVGRGWLAVDRA